MINDTNITECANELSDDQEAFIIAVSWWLETFSCMLVGVIGLVLNIFAMSILITPTMWNNLFNRLLLCLTAYDVLFILCGLLEIFRQKYHYHVQQYLFVHLLYPIRSMSMCCSIYTTIVLTLERYQAITSPIRHRNQRANNMANITKPLLIYILPVTILSIVYYLPKFFDLTIAEGYDCDESTLSALKNDSDVKDIELERRNCTPSFKIRPTNLRINKTYIFWYLNVSNLIVTCVVPIILLIFMNARIAISLQQLQNRRSKNNANRCNKSDSGTKNEQQDRHHSSLHDVKKFFILFSIVVLFILCHSLRITMNFAEFVNAEILSKERQKGCNELSYWHFFSIPLSEILLLLNASAHFFVYLLFDKTFQEIAKNRLFSLKRFIHCSFENSRQEILQMQERIPLKDKEDLSNGNIATLRTEA